jgi:NADH-quinone oxidoreductase subunit M
MLFNFLNFTPAKSKFFLSCEILANFCQQVCIYISFLLFFIFLVTILLTKTNTNTFKFTSMFNVIKYTNMTLLGFIFILTFSKFLLYLWTYKFVSFWIGNGSWHVQSFNFYISTFDMNLNSSILSDVIVLLAFSSGIVCLYLLGEKNLSKYLSNLSIFSIFLVSIIFMVYTTNLLVMFLGFEFLFIPTLYFVYSHGYVQRADKTIKILLYWTLFGAFLVFSSLGYLYTKYKTLNYFDLTLVEFSFWENIFLYIAIFTGFGIKVPVFPFHYWLTKIHVEAPAGFSIFLSGFLVKAAIYCFYYFNLIFNLEILTTFTSTIALIGVAEASIKMWTQTDFKKLIAFATIQEMNLILYILLNCQNLSDYSLILFILIHGW